MAKFKVGDFVVPIGDAYSGYPTTSKYNLPRTPCRVVTSIEGAIKLDLGHNKYNQISPPVNPHCFDLASRAGPIRTVTRREIVPGVYGIVDVGGARDGGVLAFVSTSSVYSAEQLRAAAVVFCELADVLQENAGG